MESQSGKATGWIRVTVARLHGQQVLSEAKCRMPLKKVKGTRPGWADSPIGDS